MVPHSPPPCVVQSDEQELEAATQDDASGGGEFAELLQPFDQRDHAVMSGLLNRSAVYNDAELLCEAEAMQASLTTPIFSSMPHPSFPQHVTTASRAP